MPRLRIATAGAVALCAGAALAQGPQPSMCEQNLKRVVDEHDGFLGGATVPPAVEDLRRAAMRLVAQDREENCETVVGAIEVALEGYQAAAPAIRSAPPAPAPTDLTRAQLESRLVPFSETSLDSSAVNGAEVYNYDDNKLGEAEGLLMVAGQPTHLVIRHGGWWKLGGDRVAVPVDDVRWDPEWQAFFIPITDEALDKAPTYGAEGEPWNPETNDQFFAEAIN